MNNENKKITTHYDVLGVAYNASDEEIKAAYRVLVKRYHPDVSRAKDKEKTERMFNKVIKAYSILSNEDSRKKYDKYLYELFNAQQIEDAKNAQAQGMQEMVVQKRTSSTSLEPKDKKKKQDVPPVKPSNRKLKHKKTIWDKVVALAALVAALIAIVLASRKSEKKPEPDVPSVSSSLEPEVSSNVPEVSDSPEVSETPEVTASPEDIDNVEEVEDVEDIEDEEDNFNKQVEERVWLIMDGFNLENTPYTEEQARAITEEVIYIINGFPVKGDYSPQSDSDDPMERKIALMVAYYLHYLGNSSTIGAVNNIGVGANPDTSIRAEYLSNFVLDEIYYDANPFERAVLMNLDEAKNLFVTNQTKEGVRAKAEEISEFIARLVFTQVAVSVDGQTRNVNILDLDDGIQYLVDRKIRDLTPFLTTILGEDYVISYNLAADNVASEDTIENAKISDIEDALNNFDCTTTSLTQLIKMQVDYVYNYDNNELRLRLK